MGQTNQKKRSFVNGALIGCHLCESKGFGSDESLRSMEKDIHAPSMSCLLAL